MALGRALGRLRGAPKASKEGRLLGDGAVVGNWRVLGRIGKGGNGEVYRVEHVESGSLGALKVPHAGDLGLRRRFELELEVLERIAAGPAPASRHFPRVLDNGIVEGKDVPYLVMELLQDLECPRKSSGGRNLILGVSESIRELHACGYLHRDIKLENLMQRKGGEVVLIDFGLACRLEDLANPMADRISITEGRLGGVGTPGASAPEQLSGSGVSIKSEIYALGALASDCFNGKPPSKWVPIIEKAIYPKADYRFQDLDEFESAVRNTAPRLGWVSYAFFLSAALIAAYVYLIRPAFVEIKSIREDAKLEDLAKSKELVRYYQKVAEKGDAEAQTKLGECYEYGDGVEKNPHEALKWYLQAAAQGEVKAQYNIGRLYFRGEGVEQDFAQSESWCRKAAERGLARAQWTLGDYYYYGDAVPKDLNQAVYWYQKAADQGEPQAQCILGNLYFSGDGVEESVGTAVALWQKAAEQGLAEAQFKFGSCFLVGCVVDKDLTEAIKWLEKSALQGNEDAQAELTKLVAEAGVGTIVAPAVLRRVRKLVKSDFAKGDGKWFEGIGKFVEGSGSLTKVAGKLVKEGVVLKEASAAIKGIGAFSAALLAFCGFLFRRKRQ